MDVFEVTITKWADGEGLEKQEIGRLLLRGEPSGCACRDFTYQIDENTHPLVPYPLRARGHVGRYPVRQTVWALVYATIATALGSRPN
jgi:hypothetical protein